MNRLLYRLLGRHVNAGQLAGFVLANLCGMAIVLAAVQFYSDVKPLFTASDGFMQPGHIVLTKRVNTLGTLTGSSPAFSDKEINRLRQQPFVKSLAKFTPAMFNVFATVGSKNIGMEFSTEMFFEAVPDEYLDVQSGKWHYDPDSDNVPIILPRAYLNLYNFGFASSQGLPTLSENIVGKVSVRLRLTGTRSVKLKTGRVVAFSRRLNTILVPLAFINDMNRLLSPDREPQAARIIVATDNPADERLATYISDYNYDTEAGDTDAARTASLLRTVLTVVFSVGVVISTLAFYVLLLSIFLVLQKQTTKIDNLLLIGYTPTAVARPFHLFTIFLNSVVFLGSLGIVLLLRSWYLPLFGNLYTRFLPSNFLPTLLVGLAIFLLVTALNYLSITRRVRTIWHLQRGNKRGNKALT